ncbi:MAG: hypothetical protein C4530_06580 [Desulfobacteraceae bacterium]|nr:MAG: hypothetical protein C4530_06580 [Desulfobacteraceae bacterium]
MIRRENDAIMTQARRWPPARSARILSFSAPITILSTAGLPSIRMIRLGGDLLLPGTMTLL